MTRKKWSALWLILLAGALLPAGHGAAAQGFPNGTIKILVGFPPGGTTDIIARDVGQELEKAWHNTVIVENRAGANGAMAAAQLAKMPRRRPDADDDRVRPHHQSADHGERGLRRAQGFHRHQPAGVLAAVDLRASGFPANDIKGAIALAKEKPNTIGYATPGVGSIQQLSMELLSYLSGAKFLHVPYRGGAPA